MEKLEAFIYNYPGSIYGNDANFAIANLFYSEGDYTSARRQYQKVNQYELRTSQQDEYNFKSGHSYFSEDNYTKASESLKLVNRSGEYGVHTRYYLAYMDYASGEYAAAKREFQQLASEPAYEKVIPFYLL